MRYLAFFGVLGVTALAGVGSSQATEGPWCISTKSQMMNCSIPSFRMCQLQALPENGNCWPNPNYHGGNARYGRGTVRSKKNTRNY
jgi:hypothetical protein